MPMFVTGAGIAFLAFALWAVVYSLLTCRLAEDFAHRTARSEGPFPSVTLLKPLHLEETALRENLESFCNQDYPAPHQIVFGVQALDDSAIAIVRDIQARHPDLDIALVADTRSYGANPKISNLINMAASAKYDMLVVTDSDIRITPDYLRKLVSVADQPGIGAVTCLYVGSPVGNFWSKLSAAGINYQFLPNVVLAYSLGLATPCLGSTVGLNKSVLRQIGGFEAFRNSLADDFEIGQAGRALGYRIALPAFTVIHTCAEESAGSLFAHELRWARTIKAVASLGYAGSIVTHTLPIALIGAVLLGFTPDALLGLSAILAARLYLKQRIDVLFGCSPLPFWILPLRDVISFATFIASFFGKKVDWRGARFQIEAAATLKKL
jgi:ceramide glucosyltransferase